MAALTDYPSKRQQAPPLDATRYETRAGRIRAIYEANYNQVYYTALRYGGGNVAWAEDVVQDVFMTLVDKLDTLKPGLDPGPWLSRVTANLCLNKLRREKRWHRVRQLWPGAKANSVQQDPELLSGMRESVQKAYLLIQGLPPKERAAFFMHRIEGQTQEEVAGHLGYTKGYVNKLIKRADTRLASAGWKREQDEG